MKNLFLCLSLLFSVSHAHAFEMVDGALVDVNSEEEQIMGTAVDLDFVPVASESDEVPANLKILGKGILNTDDNISLAVACVGKPEVEGAEPTCNQLRTVEFDANRIPHWEGSAFEIKSTESFQIALKKEYRKKYRLHFLRVKKDMKNTKAAGNAVGKLIGYGGMGILIAAAAGIKFTIGWSVASGLAILIGPWVLLIVLSSVKVDVVGAVANGVMAPFRGLGNSMVMDGSTSMTASSGWNWAEKPTEVSNKKYSKIKALLADFANGGVKVQ
jgi:hypothetical protein